MMARAAAKEKPAPQGGAQSETPPPAIDRRKRAVRVKASTLHAALKDVLDVVQGKNTIPILSHVRFGAGDGRIELTVTDLDCWAIRDLSSDDRDGPASKDWLETIRPFTVTLPAKPLADVLGEFDGDAMVTIVAPADLTETYSGQVTVSAGRARFKLLCLPAAEFPLPPSGAVGHSFEMRCSQLADALAAVKHAISTEETRYYLNGVYLHPHELELRLATTDGSRLARLTLEAPDGAASFPSAIVARRTVGLLDKLLHAAAKTTEGKDTTPASVMVETVGGGLGGELIRWAMPAADGGEIEILAKTIDGSFPDYERVIPSGNEHHASIARSTLAEAIKRVMVLAPKESRCVKAEFSADKLTLSVASAELGEAREEVPCDYAGAELAIGFNGAFWLQALGALACDTVVMSMHDAGAPTLVVAPDAGDGEPGRLVQVLMPMRV